MTERKQWRRSRGRVRTLRPLTFRWSVPTRRGSVRFPINFECNLKHKMKSKASRTPKFHIKNCTGKNEMLGYFTSCTIYDDFVKSTKQNFIMSQKQHQRQLMKLMTVCVTANR